MLSYTAICLQMHENTGFPLFSLKKFPDFPLTFLVFLTKTQILKILILQKSLKHEAKIVKLYYVTSLPNI